MPSASRRADWRRRSPARPLPRALLMLLSVGFGWAAARPRRPTLAGRRCLIAAWQPRRAAVWRAAARAALPECLRRECVQAALAAAAPSTGLGGAALELCSGGRLRRLRSARVLLTTHPAGGVVDGTRPERRRRHSGQPWRRRRSARCCGRAWRNCAAGCCWREGVSTGGGEVHSGGRGSGGTRCENASAALRPTALGGMPLLEVALTAARQTWLHPTRGRHWDEQWTQRNSTQQHRQQRTRRRPADAVGCARVMASDCAVGAPFCASSLSSS